MMLSKKIVSLNTTSDFTFYKDPEYKGDISFGTDHRIAYPTLVKGLHLFSTEGLKSKTILNRVQFYFIVLCIKGESRRTIGLNENHIYPNTIHFLFPGQINQNPNISKELLAYNVVFSPDFILNNMRPHSYISKFPFFTYGGTPCFELSSEDALLVKSILEKMDTVYKSDYEYKEDLLRTYIDLILHISNITYLKVASISAGKINAGNALVNKFKALVTEHYLTKHKVKEYADLLNVTPNHLNETVKTFTGKTCMDIIQEMLLLEAKILLMQTDMPINEIYDYLHFEDQAYFSRFFKTHTGVSPTEFRKSNT